MATRRVPEQKIDIKGGSIPMPNTRYHDSVGIVKKYRCLREISAVPIPFDTSHDDCSLEMLKAFLATKTWKTNVWLFVYVLLHCARRKYQKNQ